jgi:type I restriction enzyme S subunit
MFGDPVKNPKDWEKKTLKEFGEIITGNTPSREKPEFYGDYIEWIKSNNINTPYIYLTRSEEMLSEKGVKVGRIAPINSVLVTCIAGSLSCIGNVAIADRDVAFNQQINAIVPNETVNTTFLYHLILNTKEYIQSHSTQSMKGMVSKGVFGSISFIMPPIEAQMNFAEFTKRVENMITSQNQSSLEINNLFDALMQKAFIGELVS